MHCTTGHLCVLESTMQLKNILPGDDQFRQVLCRVNLIFVMYSKINLVVHA